jgi:hypothetical protein
VLVAGSKQHAVAILPPGKIVPIWDANAPAILATALSHVFVPQGTAAAEEPAAEAPAADRPAVVVAPGVPPTIWFVVVPGAGSLAQPKPSARLTSAPTYNVATFFIAD